MNAPLARCRPSANRCQMAQGNSSMRVSRIVTTIDLPSRIRRVSFNGVASAAHQPPIRIKTKRAQANSSPLAQTMSPRHSSVPRTVQIKCRLSGCTGSEVRMPCAQCRWISRDVRPNVRARIRPRRRETNSRKKAQKAQKGSDAPFCFASCALLCGHFLLESSTAVAQCRCHGVDRQLNAFAYARIGFTGAMALEQFHLQ